MTFHAGEANFANALLRPRPWRMTSVRDAVGFSAGRTTYGIVRPLPSSKTRHSPSVSSVLGLPGGTISGCSPPTGDPITDLNDPFALRSLGYQSSARMRPGGAQGKAIGVRQ